MTDFGQTRIFLWQSTRVPPPPTPAHPSMTHPLGYHQTNVNGTLRLLEFCRSMGVPHFVFASSSSVYGPNGPLRGPNDLVFDADGGLWFTDLGKTRARDMDYGAVYYARPDGSSIVEVVQPMLTPNGIGLSPDGKRLYVAETRAGRLWAWDIEGPGKLGKQPFPSPWGGTLMVDMSTYRLFDSLAVDAAGNVCVASLMEGGITVVSPQGGEVEFIPMPDVYTTNLCFGGPGLKTAFVTLSTTGKLVSIDWPRAGTPLNFLNG